MSHTDPFAAHDAEPVPVPDPGTLETRIALDEAYGAFPEDRFRRVGATDEDIAGLRAAWEAQSIETQAAVGLSYAGAPDPVILADLVEYRGNADEIAAAVQARADQEAADAAAAEAERQVVLAATGGVDLTEGVKKVLAAIDGDPVKAAAALVAEQVGQNRSSLVEALERIAAKAPTPDAAGADTGDDTTTTETTEATGDAGADATVTGDTATGDAGSTPAAT